MYLVTFTTVCILHMQKKRTRYSDIGILQAASLQFGGTGQLMLAKSQRLTACISIGTHLFVSSIFEERENKSIFDRDISTILCTGTAMFLGAVPSQFDRRDQWQRWVLVFPSLQTQGQLLSLSDIVEGSGV